MQCHRCRAQAIGRTWGVGRLVCWDHAPRDGQPLRPTRGDAAPAPWAAVPPRVRDAVGAIGDGRITSHRLARRMGISRDYAQRLLRHARYAGLIEKTGRTLGGFAVYRAV